MASLHPLVLPSVSDSVRDCEREAVREELTESECENDSDDDWEKPLPLCWLHCFGLVAKRVNRKKSICPVRPSL